MESLPLLKYSNLVVYLLTHYFTTSFTTKYVVFVIIKEIMWFPECKGICFL